VIATSAQLKIHPAPSLDLGEFPAESAPTARFELFNRGSNKLPIVEVISGCDCLEPIAYGKQIQSKESVPLDVLINGNLLSGPFEKEILIRIGGENPTNAVLKIRGTARPPIILHLRIPPQTEPFYWEKAGSSSHSANPPSFPRRSSTSTDTAEEPCIHRSRN